MATSKTLAPTNVTIQIPEFTDQPDQRVNSNCIDKEADAINTLNNQIATYAFGNMASLSAFETALDTYCSGLADNSYREASVRFTAASSPFGSTYYIGSVTKIATNRYHAEMRQTNSGVIIYGYRTNDGWTWDTIAKFGVEEMVVTTNGSGNYNLGADYNFTSRTIIAIQTYRNDSQYETAATHVIVFTNASNFRASLRFQTPEGVAFPNATFKIRIVYMNG